MDTHTLMFPNAYYCITQNITEMQMLVHFYFVKNIKSICCKLWWIKTKHLFLSSRGWCQFHACESPAFKVLVLPNTILYSVWKHEEFECLIHMHGIDTNPLMFNWSGNCSEKIFTPGVVKNSLQLVLQHTHQVIIF